MYLTTTKPYTPMALLTSQQKEKHFQEVQELRKKREEEKRIVRMTQEPRFKRSNSVM